MAKKYRGVTIDILKEEFGKYYKEIIDIEFGDNFEEFYKDEYKEFFKDYNDKESKDNNGTY